MINLRKFQNADFERGAPRWKEGLWILVKCLFFLTPWPWPSIVRVTLLRAFGAEVGRRVVIRSGVHITFPWRVAIGDDVWLGEEALLLSLAQITIENDVCISQRAFLCTGSHDFRQETFDLLTKPITIRCGSWVGAQAFIAPGVEVKESASVMAGSVVVKAVPAGSVVRGNPAVPIQRSAS